MAVHPLRGQTLPITLQERDRAGRSFVHLEVAVGVGVRLPVEWTDLVPASRELLRHPLMVFLFHRAYAGNAMPPAVGSVDAVDAWDGVDLAERTAEGARPYGPG